MICPHWKLVIDKLLSPTMLVSIAAPPPDPAVHGEGLPICVREPSQAHG
jgi:hypothetical protein